MKERELPMFEKINIHSSVAVYKQIENEVLFGVSSGALKADDKIPSIRGLSEKVGLNPNTVAKAYRGLEIMGVVYTRRGGGVFVTKTAGTISSEDCRKRIAGRIHEVVSEAKAAGMSTKDIKEIVSASYASEGAPYGDVPDSVMATAKKVVGKK